ncbi:restriction endonuclease subunit S [Proteiniclasticum ruminis]|uniref:Type I restriction enzyme, S subunit n=1 Tax=Proteiniclasticum ruminis TaxID=398199 RepID=A0A1I5ETV8_9CLOT|nr:restriction endonuclease subunit S [Proteiniclasticum ruminis]SFO14958.1 type I restriction enzyme, S subunit [Proteiniclasticum ruminis]
MSKKTSRLRFNKYKSSPQIGKLGDYSIKVGSGKTPKGGSSVYQNDGVILIRSQNVLDGQLELNEVAFISHEINKTMSNSEVNPNDVLLNITGASIGRCAIVPNDFPPANVNQHVCIIRADENKLDPKYLMQQILSPRIQNQINSLQAGGNREGLNFQQIRAFNVVIHDYQEQVQIGNFLSTIDSRITNQSSKIDSLQELKKGVMQKIFSQEIRFKREDGGEYPDWEYRRLCDFSTRVTRKNKNLQSNRALTISSIDGLVEQESYFTRRVASSNIKGYFLLRKGEFAYNKSYSNGYPWGSIKMLKKYDEGVLSTLYICFSIDESVDGEFFEHYFNSNNWHNEISMIAVEGARNHGLLNVRPGDFFETVHELPSLEEQHKIADFLSTLDSKIDIESQILSTLQTLKKGLLQQMFV